MKKLICIFASIALSGALLAQKKPAPPAAKAPDVKAPAIAGPVSPAPAAQAAKGELIENKWTIAAWGGYSINAKTNLVKAIDAYADSTATTGNQFTSKTSDVKTQGGGGGLDVWYGGTLQFGLGIYYLQGFTADKTLKFATGTVNHKAELNYVPIVLQVRYFFFEGIYGSVGVGLAAVDGKAEGSVTGFTSTGFPYTDTYSGSVVWTQARLGYVFHLTDLFALDIFGIFSYQIGTAPFRDTDSSGVLLAAKDQDNNGLNITPGLAAALKF